MTAFTIVPVTPIQVTGLTVGSGVKVASLSWDATNSTDTYEIWVNSANDLSTATLLGVANTPSFAIAGETTLTYFWVRAINQYGLYGEFSSNGTDYTIGSNFNTRYLNIYTQDTLGVSDSIQNIQLNVYYTTAAGAALNTGLQSFTSTVTQSSAGYTAWTNPDNARVDDTSYATVTYGINGSSENLLFKLSDLGIPSTAKITGVIAQLKGKTSNSSSDQTIAYIGDATGVSNGVVQYLFPAYTLNNTDQTKTTGTSSTLWGLNQTGLLFTPAVVTSADVLSPTSVISSSTSISVTNNTPTVSSYGVWYDTGYSSFDANVNNIINISQYSISTISSVTCTGTQILRVWYRVRLYDATLSTDVPAGTQQYLVYYNFGGVATGNLGNIANSNQNYIVGFRGLLVNGHTYRIYIEWMKEQAVGAPTCTLTLNGSSNSASGSATVS